MITTSKVHFIKRCPECNTPLIRYEGEAAHYCPNEDGCPPQIKGKIEHFISRKAMNIDGLGPETIDLFYRIGWLKDVSDLYHLKENEIAEQERLGEKSAKNIVEAIENSRNVPFERVLFALGIRFVGETVAKKLANAFINIDALMNASEEDLISVDEIGIKIAQSIHKYFEKEGHLSLISRI